LAALNPLIGFWKGISQILFHITGSWFKIIFSTIANDAAVYFMVHTEDFMFAFHKRKIFKITHNSIAYRTYLSIYKLPLYLDFWCININSNTLTTKNVISQPDNPSSSINGKIVYGKGDGIGGFVHNNLYKSTGFPVSICTVTWYKSKDAVSRLVFKIPAFKKILSLKPI
jgi:hypothetical protein